MHADETKNTSHAPFCLAYTCYNLTPYLRTVSPFQLVPCQLWNFSTSHAVVRKSLANQIILRPSWRTDRM